MNDVRFAVGHRSLRLDKTSDVEFYCSWPQRTSPFMTVIVRLPLTRTATEAAVRGALNKIDPGLLIIQPTTMTQVVAQSLGGTASHDAVTRLACGGGVAARDGRDLRRDRLHRRTTHRSNRSPHGAWRADYGRNAAGHKQGVAPVLIGLVLGLVSALLLGRLLTAQLYQISDTNPALLAGTLITFAAVGFIAWLVPARRASLVNRIQALRTE